MGAVGPGMDLEKGLLSGLRGSLEHSPSGANDGHMVPFCRLWQVMAGADASSEKRADWGCRSEMLLKVN